MRYQHRPGFASDKRTLITRTFRPCLEEIETRLLPGETIGLGFLASFHLLDSVLSLPLNRYEPALVTSELVRTEATDMKEPGWRRVASASDPRGLLTSTKTLSIPSEQPQSPAHVALFAANVLTNDLAHAPFDGSALFAAARPRSPHALAAVDVSGIPRASGTDAAPVPQAAASASSTSGTAQAGNAATPATLPNAGAAHLALTGTERSSHSGHVSPAAQGPSWSSYAHDPQHTAISDVPAQPLTGIRWKTPVDLAPQYSGDDLFIHYGSPLVTQANTVIVPVKTGSQDGFAVEGFDGGTGTFKWSVSTDYSVPDSSWTPPMSPVLTPGNRLYIPGAGGTVYYIDDPDASNATITGQLAFYGIANYDHGYDSSVKISTPLTSDSSGNLYFGFLVTGPTALNLQSGIARMDPTGNGSWVAATTAASDPGISQPLLNCAPALSNDQRSLYIAVSTGGGFGSGYLLRLDSATLATTGQVFLRDPWSGDAALLPDVGTASPTVGPDGDVYFGVLENPFPSNHDRGWLLHLSGDLTQTKLPGAFGWDDTAAVVPAGMVPSYTGTSPYLLMTKYNNYKGLGGDGVNKLAVLDPNTLMVDPITGQQVMQEVLTIAGVTPDPDLPMVREWCINTAAVDPATKSVLANSEDGTLYRWDLVTNSFTQSVNLTSPTGEAYTPTVIGVDGTVYAINNATLFAIG